MTETYKPGDKVLIVATVDAVNNDDPVQPIRVRIAGELANIWPRAEDIHGLAPPAHTGETVRVRVPVVVDAEGQWATAGQDSHDDDHTVVEEARWRYADTYEKGGLLVWITADVPLPTIYTITAKVEDGE